VWNFFPAVQLWLTPRDVTFSASLLIVASLIAAIAPMFRLSKIDPMEAFRS
jgi:ABC-type antimicrobial peptide transport system permease subunit